MLLLLLFLKRLFPQIARASGPTQPGKAQSQGSRGGIMSIRVGGDASLGARSTGSCPDLGSGSWPGSGGQRVVIPWALLNFTAQLPRACRLPHRHLVCPLFLPFSSSPAFPPSFISWLPSPAKPKVPLEGVPFHSGGRNFRTVLSLLFLFLSAVTLLRDTPPPPHPCFGFIIYLSYPESQLSHL